jgi:hypothetical protein
VAHYGASSEGGLGSPRESPELIMPGSRVRVPPLLSSKASRSVGVAGPSSCGLCLATSRRRGARAAGRSTRREHRRAPSGPPNGAARPAARSPRARAHGAAGGAPPHRPAIESAEHPFSPCGTAARCPWTNGHAQSATRGRRSRVHAFVPGARTWRASGSASASTSRACTTTAVRPHRGYL